MFNTIKLCIFITLFTTVSFADNQLADIDESGNWELGKEVTFESILELRDKVQMNEIVAKRNAMYEHLLQQVKTSTTVEKSKSNTKLSLDLFFFSFGYKGSRGKYDKTVNTALVSKNAAQWVSVPASIRNELVLLEQEIIDYIVLNNADLVQYKLMIFKYLQYVTLEPEVTEGERDRWNTLRELVNEDIAFLGTLDVVACVKTNYIAYQDVSKSRSSDYASFSLFGLFSGDGSHKAKSSKVNTHHAYTDTKCSSKFESVSVAPEEVLVSMKQMDSLIDQQYEQANAMQQFSGLTELNIRPRFGNRY